MKPVEIEENITKLKSLIAEVSKTAEKPLNIEPILDNIESQIKQMDDAKESQTIIWLLSLLLLPLSCYLIYKGYYWPSLIAVAWIGAILYYRVNERSLAIATLKEKAKIAPHQFGTKINYLLSGLHQKQGRFSLIKIFNIVFWPFVFFMGQLILNEGISTFILWIILLLMFVINALFWNNYYKRPVEMIKRIEGTINDLNYQLIIADNRSTDNLKLYSEEE